MTAAPKAPKKEKEKRQTPEERLEAMRYNHMMYGPTEGELKLAPKKIDYGISYIKHPKFQSLMTAFKRGAEFKFDVTSAGKVITIATDGSHITVNGKVLFYSRMLNRYENNLLLNKATAIQNATSDPLVHLVFAVLRSFPELAGYQVNYLNKKFWNGSEALDTGQVEEDANLLIGSFKHNNTLEKTRR
ncbi:hypothetical protein [Geothrix sp. 21YS21S-2]|uniref:hypothetical protein n=1 Tax=Geothrix sp. 21YS21S-2 TaxID=3068893 RepID=UPI0027BABABD|nr:hypothetical protein [Geothrix sp. 21YS21S-2]